MLAHACRVCPTPNAIACLPCVPPLKLYLIVSNDIFNLIVFLLMNHRLFALPTFKFCLG